MTKSMTKVKSHVRRPSTLKTKTAVKSKAGEKIQKVLANYGIESRREIERWIEMGRIQVNGKNATIGQRVKPTDRIHVDHQLIAQEEQEPDTRVIIYHKTPEEICTRQDPEKRKTVYDALPKLRKSRWISIGRLDFTTSGLMLFTNNGVLANKLTKNTKNIEREYLVRVRGKATQEMIDRMLRGVHFPTGKGFFSKIIFHAGEGINNWYFIVLTERNNRFIKSLLESQGLLVSRLKQIRFGPIALAKQVHQGCWTELKNQSLQAVLDLANQNIRAF